MTRSEELGKVREKYPDSFGARFGLLVYRYRQLRVMSLEELAEQLFDGDKGRKSDISELENCYVRKPQPKTVSNYAAVLEIPQEEIDACHESGAPKFPEPTERFRDVLRLQEDHILRKVWDPKAVRFGLNLGLLEAIDHGVVFSSEFRRNLCEMASKYLSGDLENTKHLGDVVATASARTISNPDGSQVKLPLDLNDLTYLINELMLHTVKLVVEIAHSAEILCHTEPKVERTLENELFDELAKTFGAEDSPTQDARRMFTRLLQEIVHARLVLHSPSNSDFAPVIVAFLFDSLYTDLVSGLEVRAWER